jgi:membrane protease YdiL (CAAX protease family)
MAHGPEGRRVEGGVTHRPVFWIILGLVVASCLVFSTRFFAEAFPLAGVELAMDREGALEAARALAERHDWGPEGFRQAASFTDPDREVRVYVELEAGEDDSLRRLREEGGYHPYRWQVRHFGEGEPREAIVRFTPGGEPYGFRLRLPEDEPGAALTPSEARAFAEAEAEAEWGIDLARWELIESSQETRPGNRVDHTFVYLLRGVVIEEADFRLRLGVAGDRLSELTRTVRVPQAFSLRYAEMRTANTRLAFGASVLFLALFLVVGCGFGSFHLLRTRWLEWRAALAWGAVVATVLALASLNQLPLAWMHYDTALPASTFLLQQAAAAVGILIAGTAFLAVVFMAAESLGRRAFPDQPQQWRFWHPEVARTGPVVGRTLGGYAVAAIQIGFVVAFYMWAMRREGWWMPSEALVQPDLVASYFPWLTAISVALFSGFWEESVFRAVPIAGAALLGTRFGGRRWWILGALLLQAVVFAAAHADYPQQPSYARLAEIFLPALFWGMLYLWFGLVPVIIAHASYNLTLISIPIWVSSAPGAWVDQLVIVLLGLVPLWIVGYHVWRKGYRAEMPAWARHRAWRPPEDGGATVGARVGGEPVPATGEGARDGAAGAGASSVMDGPVPHPATRPSPPPWTRRALLGCGVVGAALLLVALPRSPDAPSLEVDRSGAEALAREALAERGIELDSEWRVLTNALGGPAASHRFVWAEGGPEVYRDLLGVYLREPGWGVRFARFSGPVEERAEEFRVELDARGEVWRVQHRLPEEREGASLEEDGARVLAHELLRDGLGAVPGELTEISAVATHRPQRRDWTFIWSDDAAYPLERGEARLRVGLAGTEPTDGVRFVHTPEEWDREQEARSGRMRILSGLGQGIYFLLFGAAAAAGLVRWARSGFDRRAGLYGMGVTVLLFGLLLGNGMRAAATGFTTTQGFQEQLVILSVGMALGALVLAGALGLTAGFVHGWIPRGVWAPTVPRPALAGIALGLLVAGVRSAAVALGPRDLPLWPSYGGASSYLPLLAPVPSPATTLIATGLFVLLVLVGVERLTGGWTRRRGVALGGLLLAGIAAPGPTVVDAPWGWLLVAIATAVGLLVLYRISRVLGLAFVPWMVATVLAVQVARELTFGAYVGAGVGGLLGLVTLLGLAWGWGRLLEREPTPPPDGPRVRS